MGFVRTRKGRDGAVRYQALYDDLQGNRRAAGTFSTEKKADDAWRRAEIRQQEGRLSNPSRGRQLFERYALDVWLPNHQMELRTRETYDYILRRHALPYFRNMKMSSIFPSDIRAWMTSLEHEGVTPHAIGSSLTILSALFTTAFNDQVVYIHPCRGVKRPAVPKKPRRIITVEQFDALHAAVEDEGMRLLVELDVETGLRWGELVALRPDDLDRHTGEVHVTRTVIEVSRRFHPTGGRFLIKDYPKDGEHRSVLLDPSVMARLRAYIAEQGIDDDGLIFPTPARKTRPESVPPTEDLGLTKPTAQGCRYAHGTLSGYSGGRCRCEHCRGAYARYRAGRRADGRDQPRGTRPDGAGDYLSRRWFREHVWLPAVAAAGFTRPVRPHDLRHAHASWLLAGGADLQTVKDRMGHHLLSTTEKYLHTMPGSGQVALAALAKIRGREAS